MYFSIAKERIYNLLYLSNTIVERRNTMPILGNVKLTAENNSLFLSATDLEVSLVGTTEADIKNPGSITVDAKVLFEIIRELPDEILDIRVSKGQRLEIQSGSSHFKINGTSSEEFPAISGTKLDKPISVDAKKLYEMFDRTYFAVSTDETRYNINGVYAESINEPIGDSKSGIRFVSTDGHRLAIIDRPADGISISEPVIIPRKGIQEIKKVLESNEGEAEVSFSKKFFTVKSNEVCIGVRLVDGKFPDYKQIIPKENKTKISTSRSEFLSAIKRVSLVTTDKNKAVKFSLEKNELTISSSSPEYGEAKESIKVEADGNDLQIGFSSRYLIDLLGAMQDSKTINIKLNGDEGAGVFSGDDDNYICIVMPMRFEN